MGKEILLKVGVMVIVFILFIGLSSIHGFSSQVPIEKRIDRVLVSNPQFTDSSDCSMWIDNMTVEPGESHVRCYVQGSWSFIISGFGIGLQFDPAVIEDISVFWMHPPPIAEWIIIEPGLLAIGCAWFPGNYIPPGSGLLATLHIDIFEDAESGVTILNLDNFGGDPPIDCTYVDEFSIVHYPELIDGTLFIVECADIDSNGNGPDIADLVYLVDYIFQDGPAPPIMCQADIDANGVGPDIADLVYLVDYMFQGGPPPGDCCNPPW